MRPRVEGDINLCSLLASQTGQFEEILSQKINLRAPEKDLRLPLASTFAYTHAHTHNLGTFVEAYTSKYIYDTHNNKREDRDRETHPD